MPNPKPPYPAQFRELMVKLVRSGRKPGELAKELGCHATSILSWACMAGVAHGTTTTQSAMLNADERHELIELRRKLSQDVYPVYALIAGNQAELPVRAMCKTLKVSASGFYGWLNRPMCQRQKANITLTAQIREAFIASDETYGMPRIRAELMDAGIVASRKRIAALMRHGHMRGVSRRRNFCVTTERDTRQRPTPDLVSREFVAT
jgi:transposase-like protein